MKPADEGGNGYAVAMLPAPRKARRRSWTLAEKMAIIAEVERTGDPVAVVARRHDMNANHLFNWIDRAKCGTLGRRARRDASEQHAQDDGEEQEFIDLGVFTREEMAQAFDASCLLEVDLPDGVRMRVPISVEPELLTRAVRALKAA